MTVLTPNNSVAYDGNGTANQICPFDFLVYEASHLRVIRRNSDGSEDVLELGADYSVNGVGRASGGSVEVEVAATLPVGAELHLIRDVPVLQKIDFRNTGKVLPTTIETGLDLIIMALLQRLRYEGRALLLGETDTDGAGEYEGKGNRIEDLADPVNAQDAATRAFVEGAIALAELGTIPPGAPSPPVWYAVGDGVATSFDITGAFLATPAAYLVTVGGVPQRTDGAYSIDVANGKIVFSEVVPAGVEIEVRLMGFGGGGGSASAIPQYTTANMPPATIDPKQFITVKDTNTAEQLMFPLATPAGVLNWEPVATGREDVP